MLRVVNELTGYVLEAEDGEIGRCKDFLFDDEKWVIRYMVADTRKWLPGRKVLISPISLGEPRWSERRLPVRLTKGQVRESPPLDEHAPVSRQYEMGWHNYYGWSYYWAGHDLWGPAATPAELYRKPRPQEATKEKVSHHDFLRSFDEISGYRIHATDGEIGHVEDLVVDDTSWLVRYVVIDTRNWLPGRKVLVSPAWVSDVEWPQRRVTFDLTREAIKDSPPFDPAIPVNRRYEERLYDYYGRPHYWVD